MCLSVTVSVILFSVIYYQSLELQKAVICLPVAFELPVILLSDVRHVRRPRESLFLWTLFALFKHCQSAVYTFYSSIAF